MDNRILLVDFTAAEDWAFLRGMNSVGGPWTLGQTPCNGTQKGFWRNVKRYLAYARTGFRYFCRRKRYRTIVAWQQFFGLFLCYFLSLFRSKASCEVAILTFIFKEKRGLKGRIYRRFVQRALRCRQLKKICVLSSQEIGYYAALFDLPKEKFAFVPIGVDREAQFPSVKGDYFVSAGRSNRDYDFLVESFRGLDETLCIISDTYRCKNPPKNVEILDSCFGADYGKKIANSFAVIVSLCDEPVSSGQLVANNAMIYRKPIIATNNPGITDYVIDGDNGFVIEKTKESLLAAIAKLKDDATYAAIAGSKTKFSEFDYGVKVAALLSE